MKQESKRGGKRAGAGRPKKEPTTTIRIPCILKPIIERYVKIKMLKFQITVANIKISITFAYLKQINHEN